jgi:hypothetical protein
MYATHHHPRRALIALAAAALAALAIVIPGRLAIDGMSFGGGDSSGAAAAAPVTVSPSASTPQWIKNPVASPVRELQPSLVPANSSR